MAFKKWALEKKRMDLKFLVSKKIDFVIKVNTKKS